jgi:hypothetical protein
MPTPAEQKALAFFALVILLGGAARALRAGSVHPPTGEEQAALARQAVAVETAAVRARAPKKPRPARSMTRLRRDGVTDTVAGVASVPFSDVRPGSPTSRGESTWDRSAWVNGYPPPMPRIDVDNRQGTASPVAPGSPAERRRLAGGGGQGDTLGRVDVDVATAAELDRLPRVGPALAARLVTNRDSFGAFGSLEALRRVRGMGPATLRLIAPRVTFSGRPASVTAGHRY